MNARAKKNILRAIAHFENRNSFNIKVRYWHVIDSLSSAYHKTLDEALTEICMARNCESCGYSVVRGAFPECWLVCSGRVVAFSDLRWELPQ